MTDRGWTKGPWLVEYGNDAGYDGGFWEWYEAGPAKVEVVKDDDETAIANANLIAAAPDLYEALEELFNEIAAEAYPQRLRPALSKAAEAMLKAIGKS